MDIKTIHAALMGDRDAQQKCVEAGRTLPCPFCGADAAHIERRSKRGHSGGCELFAWRAVCAECGAHFPDIDDAAVRDNAGIRLTQDGRRASLESWNTRAVLPWAHNETLSPDEMRETRGLTIANYGKTWAAYRIFPEVDND